MSALAVGPCDATTDDACRSTPINNIGELLETDDALAGIVVRLELAGGIFRRLRALASESEREAAPSRWRHPALFTTRRQLRHNHATLGPGPSRLALSNRTRCAAVVVEGDEDDPSGLTTLNAIDDPPMSIITTSAGAPALTLRRIRLLGSGRFVGGNTPAVWVVGSTLTMEGCVLSGHAAGALRVTGDAHVTLIDCVFSENGLKTLPSGGAMYVSDLSTVIVSSSTFSHNEAIQGGAIYADRATLTLIASLLTYNNATDAGGGVAAIDTILLLRNTTSLAANFARSGGSLYTSGGVARYVLPAPLGHYVQAATLCDPAHICFGLNTDQCALRLAEDTNGCDSSYAGLHILKLGDSLDDAVFPPPCSAGFFGLTFAPGEQVSTQCSGICPAGFSCVQGTIAPIPCTVGSFCGAGSPLPVPCRPGTYGAGPGLESQADCTQCPAGSWCSAGQRVRCPVGTFNPMPKMSNASSCLECTLRASSILETCLLHHPVRRDAFSVMAQVLYTRRQARLVRCIWSSASAWQGSLEETYYHSLAIALCLSASVAVRIRA